MNEVSFEGAELVSSLGPSLQVARAGMLTPVSSDDCLEGGGEMGALMRALDWSTTPLGPVASWPQSLRTAVSIMLASKFPMLVLWGENYIQLYNDGYRPVLGATKHPAALGQRAQACWPEIWEGTLGPMFGQVMAGGAPVWSEDLLFLLERNGYLEETYFTFCYSAIRAENGRPGGVLCTCIETTARVLGERRLRALRDLGSRSANARSPQQACEAAADILSQCADVPFALIYLLDQDAMTARLVAQTHADAAHRSAPLELAVTDGPDPSGWPLQTVSRTGQSRIVSRLDERCGTWAHGPWPEPPREAAVLPLASRGQAAIAGFLIAGINPRREFDEPYRDFLELAAGHVATAVANARAYAEERRRAEALAELDRSKTAFFSNVSHEFRTPLTLMLGPLEEAIADAGTPAGLRARLQMAHRNSTRLLKLVNSLLDFSRIEAGRIQASYEPTDLAALTRDLASTFRSAIERAGLGYRVECEELGEPVYVDREMWEKIVLNLLSNAFKFTLAGSISVRLGRDRDRAVLDIEDTGVGVPENEIPRLFERFYRVEGTQARTHEGSGIGLALVQELVKLHGGSIEARSTLGRGTSFRISLPFGGAHLPSDRIKPSRSPGSTAVVAQAFREEALQWLRNDAGETDSRLASLTELPPPRLDQRFAATFGSRIVLADDNADMRSYLSDLLAPYYQVHAVSDGEQALAAARQQRPDLILCDVMMPRLDGFQLLRAVRADASLHAVPVVLLSARAGEEARIEGLDAGANDYLIKPFSARELTARIGALLELHLIRSRTEEALRRGKEQFETLFNAAPVGVYLVDQDFRLREVNAAARPTFGDIPDLIGRDFGEIMRTLWLPGKAEEVIQLFRHTLETGESYAKPEFAEHRLDRGTTEYYDWQIHRIPLPNGAFGVVCYFREISVQVYARLALLRQREELQAAKRDLEVADRQKDEFLAMLAHELRNPLAPIRNANEYLGRTLPADGGAQAAVGMVRRQVNQLTRLVDDLLDISRITQGRIELDRRPIELGAIITLALETVEPQLKERRHRLTLEAIDRDLRVEGDQARLVQCIVNVLSNAVKYTDPGGEIRIRIRAENGCAVIEVTDSGVGIAPELLPRMFDLFVQGTRSLDRAQGGLGIGLSVVKRLIEMHGGSVAAHSPGPGQGSTIELRLPLIADLATVEREPAKTQPPALRVLVVDDNQDAATSLAMILELDGHAVQTASSGAEALGCAGTFRPQVVLLDIGLPGIDGYEVARQFRELPDSSEVRLIAISGYGQESDRQRASRAGFEHHIVKPVDFVVLERILAGMG
jgi:signal transduction histidine kinase/response regulator of citrate/malate metabolism